jgi:hypothetical protein
MDIRSRQFEALSPLWALLLRLPDEPLLLFA